MGIAELLLVWLIVNALFVVWRALVVSSEMKTRDQPVCGEGSGHPLSQQALRRRLGQ